MHQFSFVNYAHRGASHYAPENTFQAFYEGLRLGADGIETDIQLSRDGVPVLFHDDTLSRVCGVDAKVSDLTLAELKNLLVAGPEGSSSDLPDLDMPPRPYTLGPDRICTLAEFLQHFGFRKLTFALEIKMDHPRLDEQVLALIQAYDVLDKVIVTSFNPAILSRIRGLIRHDPHLAPLRLGYLVREWSPEVASFAQAHQLGQICLSAASLTEEVVREVQALGYSVRAWGIRNAALMKKVIALGVDGGMTINFPDLLAAELGK